MKINKASSNNKKNVIYIYIFSIIALLLFFTRGAAVEYLVEQASQIFFPVQKTFYGAAETVENTYDTFINYKQISEEKERLKKENLEYTFLLEDYKNLKEENERLRNLLELKKNTKGEFTIGEVSFQHPKDIFRGFTVNLGEKDGIEKNMVVTFKNTLVGRVEKTYANYARVDILTKENSNLSVIINGEYLGIIKGEGKSNLIYEPSVHFEVDIKVGDEIYTSGISDIYPKGIYVGRIDEITEGENGIKKYIVDYGINPFDLKEVLISPGKEKIWF